MISKSDAEAKFVSSDELFGKDKVVYIQHGESVYRLVKTRNGKLILNK
jgi:hemin uptake protein HemP